MMTFKVLIVVGPSGVGKSTLLGELGARGVVRVSPTWTTRPRRHYEDAGNIDHVFCSPAEFAEREAAGFFLETVELFGLDHRYGLPRLVEPDTGGCVPVLMLRAPLLDRVPRHFSNYVVYQVEAPRERVQEHLDTRALKDGPQGSRLSDFERELELGRRFATRIIDTSRGLAASVDETLGYLQTDFGLRVPARALAAS